MTPRCSRVTGWSSRLDLRQFPLSPERVGPLRPGYSDGRIDVLCGGRATWLVCSLDGHRVERSCDRDLAAVIRTFDATVTVGPIPPDRSESDVQPD